MNNKQIDRALEALRAIHTNRCNYDPLDALEVALEAMKEPEGRPITKEYIARLKKGKDPNPIVEVYELRMKNPGVHINEYTQLMWNAIKQYAEEEL